MRMAGRSILAAAALQLSSCGILLGSYELQLTGPQSVYRGYDVYVEIQAHFSGVPSNLYFTDVRIPQGFKYHLICSPYAPNCSQDASHRSYQYRGVDPVRLRLTPDTTVAPGAYQIGLTTEAGGEIRQLTVPMRVLALPPAPAPQARPTAPPIPQLKRWRSTMLELGGKWCNLQNPDAKFAFGVESQVWYYDGARVYFQIADYTGDKRWEGCALNIARQYRDYVLNAKGKIPGWRVFTRGLRLAYERTHDDSFRQAAILLSHASPYADKSGGVSDLAIRETAYVAEAYMEAEKLGEPRNPGLPMAIAYLLGHFDMLFVSGNYHSHQPFFDGLAAEALIEYQEMTRDPRVLPAVESMCDWIWSKGWNPKLKEIPYNPDPPGPHCSEDCQHYVPDLTNLIVPAFAWVWNQTGDPKYQKEGDEIFSHALDTDITYSGKIFSQNFRWSFDYVKWRSPQEKLDPRK